jgi:hypothetical protein
MGHYTGSCVGTRRIPIVSYYEVGGTWECVTSCEWAGNQVQIGQNLKIHNQDRDLNSLPTVSPYCLTFGICGTRRPFEA